MTLTNEICLPIWVKIYLAFDIRFSPLIDPPAQSDQLFITIEQIQSVIQETLEKMLKDEVSQTHNPL